jgi:hypothetical protein
MVTVEARASEGAVVIDHLLQTERTPTCESGHVIACPEHMVFSTQCLASCICWEREASDLLES